MTAGKEMSPEAKERVKQAFFAGRKAIDVAREEDCDHRTINRYFRMHREGRKRPHDPNAYLRRPMKDTNHKNTDAAMFEKPQHRPCPPPNAMPWVTKEMLTARR